MTKLGNGTGSTLTPAIDMSQTEAVRCPECGCEVFEQGMLLRKVSPLLTGTGQPGLVPVMAFHCVKCGTVLEEYLPEELKAIYRGKE